MLTNLLFLGLAQGQLYEQWYGASGIMAACVVSLCVSVVICVLFYYLLSKVKSLTNGHYCLALAVSALLTGAFCYLTAFLSLQKYAETNMLEQLQPGITAMLSSGTLDMIYYALFCIPVGIVIFFIVSIILKRWSVYYNVPFGKAHRQPKKK